MRIEASLCKRPGKPQRAMAEIRRMLLQKILDRQIRAVSCCSVERIASRATN
jgi:hypothetical protein